MNLKFLEDIYQTFELMKSGLYYIGVLAGVHTITFALYLAYQYIQDNSTKKIQDDSTQNKEEQQLDETLNKEIELPPPITKDEPVIQMEEITDLTEQKKAYKSLLEKKRDELNNLVLQLDNVYDSIGNIRERLEELNNKPVV
jgi:chromosome segregation ATPase